MGKLLRYVFIGSVVGATVIGAIMAQSSDKDTEEKPGRGQKDENVSPSDLPASKWKQALKETKSALKNKELTTLSASLAYYGTLAFFPTLVAFISIFSLVISQDQLAGTITAAEAYLPKEIADVISQQLTRLTERPEASAIAAALGIAVALWGSSGGIQNLLKATNHAYDVEETRGFVKLRLLSLLFTLGGMVLSFLLISLLVMRPDVLSAFGVGLPQWMDILVNVARWLLIIVLISLALAIIYRYGPDRKDPKWQWVSWGAVAATVIWAAGSALFFFYLQNFANFQASYGLFAGIVAMMLWLNLSALIILIGAEVNHRIEKQTDAVTVEG